MKKTLLTLTGLTVCLVLAGCEFSCSVGGSVPAEELETEIRLSYEDETGLVVKNISCEEAGDDTGSPISCRATNANGVDLRIDGEVTSYDSTTEKVNFDWKVSRAVAPGTLYGDAAARTLTSNTGVPVAKVICPERIVVEKGARVDCRAISPDGAEFDVTLTLTDGDGGFRARLLPRQAPST